MSHLTNLIGHFLKDRRESDGGFAKITQGDINLLYEIVELLVERKCERDPDGDMPIEFEIVNRRTHEPMHYGPVPYRDGTEDRDSVPFIEMVQVLQMNLNIAASRLDTELKIECSRQRRAQ